MKSFYNNIIIDFNFFILQKKFNINFDSILIIKNFILQHYANIISKFWFLYIKRKTFYFSFFLNLDTCLLHNFYFYNFYDFNIALSFYKAAKSLSIIDDFYAWDKFFSLLQSFINLISFGYINFQDTFILSILKKANFIFYNKFFNFGFNLL